MIALFIGNIFALCLLTYIASSFLTFRFQNKYITYFIILITLFIMMLINVVRINNARTFMMFVLIIMYVIIQFKGSPFRKIVTIMHYYIIFVIAEMTVTMIMIHIGYFNITTQPTSLEFAVGVMIANVLAFIITKLYLSMIDRLFQYSMPKYAWLIFMLPLTTMAFIFCVPDFFVLIESNTSIVIVFVGLLISNVIYIVIFMNAIKGINIRNELKLEKYKQRYSKTKYDLLDQQYKNNFNLLHNIMNKSVSLRNEIETKDINIVKKELDELIDLTFQDFEKNILK